MKRLGALLLLLAATAASAQQHPNQAKGFEPGKVYQFEGIDMVNAFNGNLIITIPISPTFRINGALSLGLKLVYNGNVWDYSSDGTHLLGSPNRRSNAGVGWVASFGRLIAPDDPSNNLVGTTTTRAFIFETPDGADHKFASDDNLAFGTPVNTESSMYPYSGAPDGAYLRMRKTSATQRIIELPDGNTQTYQNVGTSRQDWRLTMMQDRFGNTVNVTYDTAGLIMTLTDASNSSRWMRLTFEVPQSSYLDRILKKVEVTKFGGGTASYDFVYANTSIALPPNDQSHPGNPNPPPISVPLLQSVSLPGPTGNRDTYNMTYSTSGWPTGAISSLTLPTLGRIEYDWMVIDYPNSSAHLQRMPSEYAYPETKARSQSVGVSQRRMYDRGASLPAATWTYDHALSTKQICMYTNPLTNDPVDNGEPRQKVSIIHSPDGLSTVSYFSVYTQIDCDQIETVWKQEEYGKPLTHYWTKGAAGDPYGVVNRSVETYSGTISLKLATASNSWDAVNAAAGTLLKGRYIAYRDPLNDHAEAAIRTFLFHGYDSACSDTQFNCYADELRFGFDNNGHFSQSSIGGTLPNTVFRTAITQYRTLAPGQTSDPWILGLTTETCLRDEASQRTAATDCSTLLTGLPAGEAAPHARYCYNTNTGFLARKWILGGKDPATTDVVTAWTVSPSGNIAGERWYGGDTKPLTGVTASSDVCAAGLPAAVYGTDYTYDAGSLQTAEPIATGADSDKMASPNFKTADNAIDAYTGLVSTAADSAGIRTRFTYDDAGRIVETRVIDASNVTVTNDTRYTYQTATSGDAANVAVHQLPSSGSTTPLTTSTFRFDGFGRIASEERQLPGVVAKRQTVYDGLGRRVQVSEAEATPSHYTVFAYDAFSRTTSITAPDGGVTSFTYTGDREKTRRSAIALLTGDTDVTTKEVYDALGRLASITEGITAAVPAGQTVTSYGYDAADRVISVGMRPATSFTVQARSFQYDNRGFLFREEHPESGVTTYGLFDPRGHAGQKKQAQADTPYDLNFYFDAAERVVRVDARNPNYDPLNPSIAPYLQPFRPLKTYVYGTANPIVQDVDRNDQFYTNYAQGKLVTATRFNYFARSPRSDVTIPSFPAYEVAETYGYMDAAGRQTHRSTTISRDTVGDWSYSPVQSFRQRVDYDDLGAVKAVNYPHCNPCGSPVTTGSGRDLAISRVNGLVSQIPGYVSAITYWPNGMTNTVTHDNLLVDTYNIDTANNMARPLSIQFGSFSTCTPPAIASQSQEADSIGVTATGTAPLDYKWYVLDSNNIPQEILGANNASYKPSSQQSAKYFVRIHNACRTIDSPLFTVTVNTCQAPAIDVGPVSETVGQGESRMLSVQASGTAPLSYQWYRGNLGNVSDPLGTAAPQSTGAVNATTSYWVKVSNSCNDATASATLTVALPKPVALAATRTSTTQITLAWSASAGAARYSIERRSSGLPFAVVTEVTAPTTSFVDGSRIAGRTYVYRVRAMDASGGSLSAYSNTDLATMMTFTAVQAGGAVSFPAHNELLTGLNALRGANGWAPLTWAELMSIRYPAPVVGGALLSEQLTFLRSRVNEALSALGVPTASYTDPDVKHGAVKALHIQQLQQRMQ